MIFTVCFLSFHAKLPSMQSVNGTIHLDVSYSQCNCIVGALTNLKESRNKLITVVARTKYLISNFALVARKHDMLQRTTKAHTSLRNRTG